MSTKDIPESQPTAPLLGLGSSEGLGPLLAEADMDALAAVAHLAGLAGVDLHALARVLDAALRVAMAAERERLARDVADLHMAQSINNQNHPSAWHDGVDAALEVIREGTPHRMAGGCPDEVAGADSRDLDCPACQLMMELGANAEPMTACPHGVPHRWPCDECGA